MDKQPEQVKPETSEPRREVPTIPDPTRISTRHAVPVPRRRPGVPPQDDKPRGKP